MDVDLVFKIAAIGILVAVLNILLSRAGRDEQALMTTIAGLVVVLVLVILAALGFLALQRYIIYDETGRLYLELPWQKDQEMEEVPREQEQLELTIQEPEQTRRVTTAWLAAEKPVTQAALTASVSAHSLTSEVAYNAVAVTVKDAGGNSVTWDGTFPNGHGFELPQTGGTGRMLYAAGGLLLTAAGALLLYHQARRRRGDKPSS